MIEQSRTIEQGKGLQNIISDTMNLKKALHLKFQCKYRFLQLNTPCQTKDDLRRFLRDDGVDAVVYWWHTLPSCSSFIATKYLIVVFAKC